MFSDSGDLSHQDLDQGFSLVEARKQVFAKFPAELKALHVYRHFYTDLDDEASQLSLQWFAVLISYFCGLCRLEGRRVQYTQNGQSERFGAEFAKAHHRASVLFERVTGTYRKILATYNVHSRILTRKKVGMKVLKETWKMDRGGGGKSWRYTAGAKADIDKLAYESQPAFLYALDEMRFYEEFVNFTIEVLKKAFTDERLQVPIVSEMTLFFRSDAFSFKQDQRLELISKTRKSLAEAQGADSILHNCHRLAARLVPPPDPVPLKLALLQRSPFVASSMNHPLLSQLNYNRAFARHEIKTPQQRGTKEKSTSPSRSRSPPDSNNNNARNRFPSSSAAATYHVRLKEGEMSPHRREMEDLIREDKNTNSIFGRPQQSQNQHQNNPSSPNRLPSTPEPQKQQSDYQQQQQQQQKQYAATELIIKKKLDRPSSPSSSSGAVAPSLPLGQQRRSSKRRSTSPLGGRRTGEPSAPSSKDYWSRVATTKEENQFTVEVHQPMFAPSHRALSSLTPASIEQARQKSVRRRSFAEAKDRILTRLPPDSLLPRLVDFDRPDVLEEEGFVFANNRNQKKKISGMNVNDEDDDDDDDVGNENERSPQRRNPASQSGITHATTIMFGDQQEAGGGFLPLTMSVGGVLVKTGAHETDRAATADGRRDARRTAGVIDAQTQAVHKSRSPFSKFSAMAKKIASASGIRTNPDAKMRKEQKAVDRLTQTAAAASAMSQRSREYVKNDPMMFFVAPVDSETGKEDFRLYDPADEIDGVYQQLAHGVQLSHFEVPIDIGVRYDDTGLLMVE